MQGVRLRTIGVDAGYVDEKLGRELYSHLRAESEIAAFRLNAVQRAFGLYEEAVSAMRTEPQITGLGLLVLQRTLLACEDLGALLFTFADQPHELRFTSYRLGDLDETFKAVAEREVDVRALWAMPTDESITAAPGRTPSQRQAIRRLREVTARCLEAELDVVADFWLGHRRSIKNVMHGFSLVPAIYLIEPPGAGVLSRQVELTQERPFAASLVSELDQENRTVATTTYALDLTESGLTVVRDIAASACGLLARLADARLFAVRTRHACVLSFEFAERLDQADQDAISELEVDEGDSETP